MHLALTLILCFAAQEDYKTQTLDLVNPSSKAHLWARIYAPEDASKTKPYPAVLLVPGGIDYGSSRRTRGTASYLASRGIVAAVFDPDGRGRSSGAEDYNGKIHQDGLRELFRQVGSRSYVRRVGIISMSYGIAMAAGMIGRYPEDPVAFYIDWEGPSNRFYVTGNDRIFRRRAGMFGGHRTTDVKWWEEREAVRFASRFQCPYLRIQGERDHVQREEFGHALIMIEAATAKKHGGKGRTPWTRVNGSENPANSVYTKESPPKLRAGRLHPRILLQYTRELLKLSSQD